MAASVRRTSFPLPPLLTALSCLLIFLALVSDAACRPTAPVSPAAASEFPSVQLWKRLTPVVQSSADGTNTTVVNPATNDVIPQGSATDGGGKDFSVPAIIWIAFVFAVGAPLALAGIRLWRVTTGAGVGLAAAVCMWTAFINTISADSLPDLVLTIIVLVAFAIGFFLGMVGFGRMAGVILLGVLSGFSIGLRIVLLRPGLLIPRYVANWLLLVVFMIIGLALIFFRQRMGLVTACASVGSFLVALGIDLIMNKQSGMSFGLRFFMDRNNSHFLELTHKGYNPPVLTQILLGASLGAIPILAAAQHFIFRAPFRPTWTESTTASFVGSEEAVALNPEKHSEEALSPVSDESEAHTVESAAVKSEQSDKSKSRLLGARFSSRFSRSQS